MIMSHFLINTFWRLGQKYEKKNHFFLFKWELWNLLTFLHQTLTLSEKKQVAKSFWTDFILLCDADSFAILPPARPTTPPFLSNQPWTTFRHQHCIVIHNCITTKGQLISEWLFGVFNFPKKQSKNVTNFYPRI